MRTRPLFACSRCDYSSGKWFGRCPSCGAWESVEQQPGAGRPRAARNPAAPLPYPQVQSVEVGRSSTGIAELDRVLGGGLVPGAAVLIGGVPGIGKSTLLLQAASSLAESGRDVLYVSGEESAGQLRMRGDRLGVRSERLQVLTETDVGSIVDAARTAGPALLIVDSIQSVRSDECASVPGSVSQVRECALQLVDACKTTGSTLLLVGHVTKDGSIAGPRTLEHLVDTVVQFEGDRHQAHRILRTLKNRFGPSDELGVFRMEADGLHPVENPSELFLSERPLGAPGSVVLPALEGSRPLLVEIQGLVGEPGQATPRRAALGVDSNRLAMILAVLQRRAGIDLAQRDVFVNVTGGVQVTEPAADLAIAAVAASSALQRQVDERSVVLGEIGLTGEIRGVARMQPRLQEAARLGFRRAVVPPDAPPAPDGIELVESARLGEALEALFRREDRDQIG